MIPPTSSPPVAPDAGQETLAGPPRTGGRVPWRTAGIGLTSLGTPIGIGVADPLLGQIAIAIELAVAIAIIGRALYGSKALSERAFQFLRWIANRPEPPGPAAPAVTPSPARPSPVMCRPRPKAGRWVRTVLIPATGQLPPRREHPDNLLTVPVAALTARPAAGVCRPRSARTRRGRAAACTSRPAASAPPARGA